jgi:hypothetical protein
MESDAYEERLWSDRAFMRAFFAFRDCHSFNRSDYQSEREERLHTSLIFPKSTEERLINPKRGVLGYSMLYCERNLDVNPP